MNHKQKLGYMFLGAVILALGIIIGRVVTPDIEAQSNGVFDKITCRELNVVDGSGNTIVDIVGTKHGGQVRVLSGGFGAVVIGSNEHGGNVLMIGKEFLTNPRGVEMHITEFGGAITVKNNKWEEGVKLVATEDGGMVVLCNNQGEIRAVIGVNEYGNGAVSTWDKNGYRQ